MLHSIYGADEGGDGGLLVARCDQNGEHAGDARLIVAAPDLYAALERVCDTYGFDPSIDSSIWQEAFAALAKARGETA